MEEFLSSFFSAPLTPFTVTITAPLLLFLIAGAYVTWRVAIYLLTPFAETKKDNYSNQEIIDDVPFEEYLFGINLERKFYHVQSVEHKDDGSRIITIVRTIEMKKKITKIYLNAERRITDIIIV